MLLNQVFMCKNYKIQAMPGSPLISFSDMLRIYFFGNFFCFVSTQKDDIPKRSAVARGPTVRNWPNP